MDLIFANPFGLLALLALPAVVAIHFFQRKTRREHIATMFLLEDLTRRSERGSFGSNGRRPCCSAMTGASWNASSGASSRRGPRSPPKVPG